MLADLLPNLSDLPFQVRPTIRLNRNPRGKRPNPSRCQLPLCLTLKPGADRSRLSSIAYPRSASGPYLGGCSTCQASLVAADCGGPSISLLP
jgi:hypothetical protein